MQSNNLIDRSHLLSNSLVEHPVLEDDSVDIKEYQRIRASFLFDLFHMEADLEEEISDLLLSLDNID